MVGGREGGDVSAKVPSHLRESTGRKTPISSGLWSVWMWCLELWQTSCYLKMKPTLGMAKKQEGRNRVVDDSMAPMNPNPTFMFPVKCC